MSWKFVGEPWICNCGTQGVPDEFGKNSYVKHLKAKHPAEFQKLLSI